MVRLASEAETTSEVSFGDDECEIKRKSARQRSANAPSKKPDTPAVAGPRTVIRATSLIAVSAVTLPATFSGPEDVILVPGRSGAKVLRIQSGMPHFMIALRVFGCSTFAPKYASSAASRYEISGIVHAPGTSRGSAVCRPSTSFQIMTSSASKAAAKIVAE